jgi:endonuclease-3
MRITKAIKEQMIAILEEHYHGTSTALVYSTPFELLIAVILSAQCTDKRVNIITARLYTEDGTGKAGRSHSRLWFVSQQSP